MRQARFLAVFLLIVLIVPMLSPLTVFAAFNSQINYQGKLTDDGGVTVPDGNYIMKFRLYTSAVSATTTNIWEEIRTATGDRAVVTNGLFSVMLGSSTPLTGVDFNQTLYLGVEVCGTVGLAGCDGEMSPRKILGAVPAAFEAQKLGGLATSSFLRSDAVNSTTTATTFVTINQNGTGNILDLQDGGATVFTVLDGGNVGIGTTSPYALLSVEQQPGSDPIFAVGDNGSSSPHFVINANSNIGIHSDGAMFTVLGSPVGAALTIQAQNYGLLGLATDFAAMRLEEYSPNAGFESYINSVFSTRASGTKAAPELVEAGTSLYNLWGLGYGGTEYEFAAGINLAVDDAEGAAPGDNDMPGRIVFRTTPDGSSLSSERMRIDNQGRVGINTTAAGLTSILTVKGTTSDDTGYSLLLRDSSDTDLFTVRNDGFVSIFGTAHVNGNLGIATDTPGTAFASVGTFNVNNVIATSTFDGSGVDLINGGCFAIAGVCLPQSGGNAVFSSVTAGDGIFGTITATSTTGTSTIVNAFAIGTTTTFGRNKLTVAGDISALAHGDSLSSLSATAVDGDPDGIYVQDKYAYVVNVGADTFQVFDVSNPAMPALVSTVATDAEPSSIYVSGKYAYLFTDSTFQIFDVSNPSMPYVVGSASAVGGDSISGIYLSGKYLYLAGFDTPILYVFDVGNPATPALVSTTATGANPQDVYVQGKYAYVVTDSTADNVEIYDVSNPTSPVQMATVDAGNDPREIVVQGPYAYVVHAQDADFLIFNVASSTNPFKVASTTLAGASTGLSLAGRYAYVASYGAGAVQIVDVASSTLPIVVDTFAAGGSRDLMISGRYVYVTDVDNDLFRILDTGGAEFYSAIVHSLEAGGLRVYGNAFVDNDLYVQSGLNVGFQGIGTDGAFSSRSTGTASYINYRLGIGTTSPFAALSIVPENGQPQFVIASSSSSTAANMFIDSRSRTSFGNYDTTFTAGGFDLGSVFSIHRDTPAGFDAFNEYGMFTTERAGDNAAIGNLYGALKARGSLAAKTAVESGDNIWSMYGFGHDGTDYANAAALAFDVDGDVFDDIVPGRFTLSTTNNVGSNAERLRVDSYGRVGINTFGTSGPDPITILTINGTTTDDTGFGFKVRDSADTELFVVRNDGNVGIGTTSPYAKLSVVGEALATYFTATSITATSTFAGYVGIGTNTPAVMLDVYGSTTENIGLDVTNSNTAGNARLRLVASTLDGGRPFVQFDDATNTASTITLERTTNKLMNGNRNDLIIHTVPIDNASTSILFGIGAMESMRVDDNGNIGIGTTSPWRTLSVDGTVGLSSSLNTSGASEDALCIDVNGGTFEVLRNSSTDCTVSSGKYKHGVKDLTYESGTALDKVNALRPVSYLNNDDNDENIGFIAEEVFNVDERLVFFEGTSTTDTRGVKYNQMTALLTKAVQELYESLQNLTGQTITYITATFDSLFAKEVKTDKLCVGDTCVTEDQFMAMVQNAGAEPVLLPEPTEGGNTSTTTATSTDTEPDPGPTATSTDPAPEPEPEPQPEPTPEIEIPQP